MRFLTAAGLLVLGAVMSLATVAVHREWWTFALAVAATLATMAAVPAGWSTRPAYAAGWVLLVGAVANPRPEGDYVISSDAHGYALLVLTVVLVVWGLATLPRPGGTRSSLGSGA